MKKVLSLIQPTGTIHLGNYAGAVQKWEELQNIYDCKFGIADLHGMTMKFDPIKLNDNSRKLLIDLVACGIDPQRSSLFVQSWVPEHTELFWIFSCIGAFGDLSRMTQFKDKSKQSDSNEESISVGLFTYPILQAADILIYNADYVPVGKDQKQHVELTARIARKFNHRFGKTFNEPIELESSFPSLMSLSSPDKKMSKSLGDRHYLGLFESEESIHNKIRSAVTDEGTGGCKEKMSPGVENLFRLLQVCRRFDDYDFLYNRHAQGDLKYKDLKDAVSQGVVELTKTFIERRRSIDPEKVMDIVKENSENNRKIAKETLLAVKERIGLL